MNNWKNFNKFREYWPGEWDILFFPRALSHDWLIDWFGIVYFFLEPKHLSHDWLIDWFGIVYFFLEPNGIDGIYESRRFKIPPKIPPKFLDVNGFPWTSPDDNATKKSPISRAFSDVLGSIRKLIWCGWPDSNRHGSRHCPLKTACLPVPPHPRLWHGANYQTGSLLATVFIDGKRR